jgi:hypothetical protein
MELTGMAIDQRTKRMEPTIICPSCSTEIRLTETLAAPLLRATREEYETRIARKDAEVAQREASIEAQLADLETERRLIEQRVAERLQAGREDMAAEEARKAAAAVAKDLQSKAQEVSELQEVP